MSLPVTIVVSNLPSASRSDPALAPSGEGADPGVEPRQSGAQPHDGRRRLRLRLSVSTQETMKSLADAQGISQAALLDALLHGLEAADQGWLDSVIEQARRLDAHYRNEEARTDGKDPSQA